MNHPLAVYTVIYVAILFVTVSIWGGKIGDATGDYRVLLLAQAIFALKLAIDDYIHFQDIKKPDKLHLDLNLSLLVYLLLAVSIATAATERGAASAFFFASVFAVGVLWLYHSEAGPKDERPSESSEEDKRRRSGWLRVNIASALILAAVACCWPPQCGTYSGSSFLLAILVALIIIDFFHFGTLARLADLHRGGERAPAGMMGRAVAGTAEAPAAPAAPASTELKD